LLFIELYLLIEALVKSFLTFQKVLQKANRLQGFTLKCSLKI